MSSKNNFDFRIFGNNKIKSKSLSLARFCINICANLSGIIFFTINIYNAKAGFGIVFYIFTCYRNRISAGANKFTR